MTNLANLRIVLDHTSHPGNIGAAARAMKTMAIEHLCLVAPQSFPDSVAYARASGATDVLDEAEIHSTLSSALEPCQRIFATSARSRHLSLPVLDARDAGVAIAAALQQGQQVAVVFGNEQHGLSNTDIQHCHQHIIIPTNPVYGSLNLGSAVQIVCYEIFQHIHSPVDTTTNIPAPYIEQERLYHHVLDMLQAIDYLHPQRSAKLSQKLKVILQQYPLTQEQIHIIRGVLTQMEKRAKQDHHA
jgi:tRNA (cytidine32/uridine32-2'-O)-methyltransferase